MPTPFRRLGLNKPILNFYVVFLMIAIYAAVAWEHSHYDAMHLQAHQQLEGIQVDASIPSRPDDDDKVDRFTPQVIGSQNLPVDTNNAIIAMELAADLKYLFVCQ